MAEKKETLWTKCKNCEQIIYNKELEENFKVCPKCGYYFKLSAKERLNMIAEPKSFEEYDKGLLPINALNFPEYSNKLTELQKKLKLKEAIITGECLIGQYKVVICILDFDFLGGSMGSVMGEKITSAIEKAIKKHLPLVIISASGGARMQEGILSLMQMAKTSAALAALHAAKLPYISVLTDPTTGGVSASFAMLGDVNIAEPKALIGFAGPRVIEQTIREKLPDGFQLSEFLLQHGMIDMIVNRKDLKNTLIRLLNLFTG
ncbi:MAG: acetyl-CoA carboxylase, carboxyltransferase subunit beta [Elusimicrobiota bacterium]|nr:acetyl-CoA carboxylase, carboxyltransferase subunit beta [Elusimicrobiota bacterium]